MRANTSRWRRVACFGVFICLGLSGISSPMAQTTAVNGKIAYEECDFDLCDIWSINPDGTGATNLTNTPTVNEFGPAWSPDGTRIAYVEGGELGNRLMVMNSDGSGQTVATPEPSFQFGPTWSADGTQLAFTRLVSGQVITTEFDILVVNLDGSGEANITNSDFDELEPAWSPDGTRIAFAGVRFEDWLDPITGEPVGGAQWEIVTVNPDGSGEQILTAGDPGSERATHLEEDRAPAWSPDGSVLVFMSQSVDPCCPPWQIWSVNSDGTGATLLSDDAAVNDLAPSFSPDGTQIVFTSDRDAAFGGAFDLYTIPAQGTVAGPLLAAVAPTETSAVSTATRLTTSGKTSDPSWGRDPDSASTTSTSTTSTTSTTEPPSTFLLTVSVVRVGPGAKGGVRSLPPGILCGLDCQEAYFAGTRVKLEAFAGSGSMFTGWSGACTGRKTVCGVTMDAAKTVQATFRRRR